MLGALGFTSGDFSITSHKLEDGVVFGVTLVNEKASGKIRVPDSILGFEVSEIVTFRGNDFITEIELGKNVNYFYPYAFGGMYSLEGFTVSSENGYITAIDGVVYEKLDNGKYSLTCYPYGRKDTAFYVAEGTVRLNSDCINSAMVEKLYLPESVNEVDYMAFELVSNLKEVYISSAIPPVITVEGYDVAQFEDNAFMLRFSNADVKFFVPAQAVEAYKNADGWKDFADKIFTVEE